MTVDPSGSHDPWNQDINSDSIKFDSGQWHSDITKGLAPFDIAAIQKTQYDYTYRIWLDNLNNTFELKLGYRDNGDNLQIGIIQKNIAQFAELYGRTSIGLMDSYSHGYNVQQSLPSANVQWIEVSFQPKQVTLKTSNGDVAHQSLSVMPNAFAIMLSETKVATDSTPLKIEKFIATA